MTFVHDLSVLTGTGERVFFLSAAVGALFGCLVGGMATLFVTYFFARRLFKSKILDQARQEISIPLSAYREWLTMVAGEFALWNTELLPAYLSESAQDQFELNRMRKLYVDPRNTLWLAKLEEYDTMLAKFNPSIKSMWTQQQEINDRFSHVFINLEKNPPEAVKAGKRLETLAFEQGQLVSDFLYHLQYECLRSVATSRPSMPNVLIKPRIIRTGIGKIRIISPKL